ncbi:MAG: hypothetical protein K6D02_09825, partial [Lachnospiraceae bacterium]|nr:hypothetical protein [Lachnospiraceae bacterium]
MNKYESLNDYISFNINFKSSINLYLSLNKADKINSYIPTKSSVQILKDYLNSVLKGTEQASLLIGPYGKGKSHLFLVVISILSLDRTKANYKIISDLIKRIDDGSELGHEVAGLINKAWKMKPMLPVLIQNLQGDLKQSFLYAINESLKRNNLEKVFPDTFYSHAAKRISEWEKDFPSTYKAFIKELENRKINMSDFKIDLSDFSRKSLEVFMEIHPTITSGSVFNPLVEDDVLPLYKSISEILVEDYGYSGLFIVFDEFSKFIEGQEENRVGTNMKFLQDICELACNSSNAKVHITMIAHKSIKEYGKYISKDIINAFTGIEGRIVEKHFVTSSKNNYELIKDAIIKDEKKLSKIPNNSNYFGEKITKEYYEVPFFKRNFEVDDFKSIILKGCYPLNPIASYLLLNISEKVAQNERTLFTFISNDEPNSMFRFVKNHKGERPWLVGVDSIYDYFSGLFKKDVNNEVVHNEWLNAEYAISKCKGKEEKIILKVLALFLIVDKHDELPANEKLLSLASGLPEAASVISELEKANVIYRKGATNSFVFKTRAGASLKKEIKRQRAVIGDNINYNKVFSIVEQKRFIIPQRYNTKTSMTRYFRYEYLNVDEFLSINNESSFFNLDDEFCDGKVIALFSFNDIDQDVVKKHYKKLNSRRIIVLCPKKAFKESKRAIDLEIVLGLKESNFTEDNEVMTRELPLYEEDLIKQLKNHLFKIYSSEDCKIFYLTQKGQIAKKNIKNVSEAVNLCCEYIYTKTPIINNELINRRLINTGQTKKARNNIITTILKGEDSEKYYEGTNQEATIYRALYVNTGLKDNNESEELKEVISLIDSFIDESSGNKLNFRSIVDKLTMAPYGLRLGIIPLYFAWVLSKRKEDIVVYFDEKEVMVNADIIVNAIYNPADYELFVSAEDTEKERYIKRLNKLFEVDNQINLGENRIKNIVTCIQRWFRELPQITRNFSDLNGLNYKEDELLSVKRFKNLIQRIEVNPYELLFIQIPEVFELSD